MILSAITLLTFRLPGALAVTQSEIVLKPYRVVVVIDIDWAGDPQSYVESTACTFHDIATLLKLWSVPFDVLRLDQNILDISQFVDNGGKSKYGAIIWNCRQDRFDPSSGEYVGPGTRDWSVLRRAVMDYGISLIALANNILEPTIRELLGINYIDLSSPICWYAIGDPFVISKDHFITQGYNGTIIPSGDGGQGGTMGGWGCHVGFDSSQVNVLGSQGQWPQLAERDLSNETKAIWIGGNRDAVYHLSPIIANILRRAITYCIGYSIYKTYPNTVLLRMDDSGSSQKAYLPSWHFPALTREQINASIVMVLLNHNASLGVMYTPGFVEYTNRTIVKSWTVDIVDAYGTRQNLTSEYLGILNGLAKGVLEVGSHGWTHIQTDLDSPPGPWWDNHTEWSVSEWYREFYDSRRDKEIDVSTQETHFENLLQYIEEAFDTFPLSFAPPGDAISGTPSWTGAPATYTYKIAALEGFGLASDDNGYYYLGPPGDMVISQMRMTRTYMLDNISDIRTRLKAYGGWDIPVMAYFHDKDIYTNPSYLNNRLTQLQAPSSSTENSVQDYISHNEFIGYLHAKTSVSPSQLSFIVQYDDHYCTYFANHSSKWTLHFSDYLLTKFRNLGKIDIIIDGTYNVTVNALTYFNEIQDLSIPLGIGTHEVRFGAHHDVAITSVVPSTFQATVGTVINITVTAGNEGSIPETFNVSTYYNSSKIGSQTVTNLAPGTTTNLAFHWDTGNLVPANYTLMTEASIVLGEIDTADNTHLGPTIRIVKSPTAIFTYSPSNPEVGDPVLFNASASMPNGGVIIGFGWCFDDGNTTTTANSTMIHTYAFRGTYNVTLEVTDSEGLSASTWNTVIIASHNQTMISISTFASSKFVGFNVEINGTLADSEGNRLSGAIVILSHTFSGISEWIPLTSATTDTLGTYDFTWIPPLTGQFTIRTEWAGNDTYAPASNSSTLNVIPYGNRYIFSVASNSTISALTFNSTSLQLSFTATGPSGTTGFAQVTIAKTLVANITDLKVYLDGSPLEFSTSSTDDSWIAYFTYSHSTHEIRMALSAMFEHASAETLPMYALLLPAIAMCIVSISAKKHKHARSKSSKVHARVRSGKKAFSSVHYQEHFIQVVTKTKLHI